MVALRSDVIQFQINFVFYTAKIIIQRFSQYSIFGVLFKTWFWFQPTDQQIHFSLLLALMLC